MDLNLKNKTALVCGSTQGIGWATAVELALLGANVYLLARNEGKLKACIEKLDISLNQIHGYCVADFEKEGDLIQAISEFPKVKEIDILVNNTGGPAGGEIQNEEENKFRQVFEKHLINNQILVKAVLEGMKERGFGRIINVISISVKQPIPGLGVSNTVRWAVAGWAKTLSRELGKYGITVNNVLPGLTSTQRLHQVNTMRAKEWNMPLEEVEKTIIKDIPVGRFAFPEEVAAAVAFLATPVAASITGVNIPVDGGLSWSL
ncbi:MAG: SDR family oxidoreductase [Leadbetterella sp.]